MSDDEPCRLVGNGDNGDDIDDGEVSALALVEVVTGESSPVGGQGLLVVPAE